jgi:hypothetical protein
MNIVEARNILGLGSLSIDINNLMMIIEVESVIVEKLHLVFLHIHSVVGGHYWNLERP